MGDIKVNLDLSALKKVLETYTKDVIEDIQKGVKGLSAATYGHIKEQAQNKLKSSREMYLENLGPPEQIDKNIWVITLNKDAGWIEEGSDKPYDMKPGLLNTTRNGKSPPQTNEAGEKYRVVPMNQNKTPTQITSNPRKAAYEKAMVKLVKDTLKDAGISSSKFNKLEIDPKTGSPRIGKVASFDIKSNIPGKGNTPQLFGLNVYQKLNTSTNKVERNITTFRTVKADQDGKWIHPPVEAKNFMLEAKSWAEQEWENKWLPQILEKYK